MRFNATFARIGAALALVITAGASSCSINEGPAPERKRQIKDGNGCMQDFQSKIEQYFDGLLTDQDIDGLAKCATDAIVRFQNVVRGQTKGTFTAREIRDFLQYYYLDDLVVNDSLLDEVMLLKVALLGGRTGEFTADDLNRAKEIIGTIANQLRIARPHLPYGQERLKKLSVQEIEEAAQAMKSIAENISGSIRAREPGYTLADLDQFLAELQAAFPKANAFTSLRKQIPLAATLKEAIISPGADRNRITAKDWKVLLEDGAEWFGIYIRSVHFSGNYAEKTRGPGRERLAVLMNDAITLLARIPARHSYKTCRRGSDGRESGCHQVAGVVPYELIFRVIDTSGWDGIFMGRKFSLTTVKQEIVPLTKRLLAGTDLSKSGRAADGVTVEMLERLRQTFNEWNEGARYIEGLYLKLSGDQGFTADQAYTAAQLSSVSVEEALLMNGRPTALGREMAEDLRRVIIGEKDLNSGRAPTRHPQAGPSLLTDESGRVHFDYELFTRPKTYSDLMNYVWIRPLFRLVIRGYLSGKPAEIEKRAKQIWKAGLKEDEFIRFVADFWPALVDFKFVGKYNSPSLDGGKRFMEANLFGFAGNGDDEIDMDEAAHLLIFLISTKSISDNLIQFSHQNCPTGSEDEFGVKTVEPVCFREKAFNFDSRTSPVKDLYRSFPNFSRYYESLSPLEQTRFRMKLAMPVRTPDSLEELKKKRDPFYNSSEIDAVIMMIHYVEAMYMRFDTGGVRGAISHTESKEVLNVFKRTLGEFAGMKPNSYKLKAVFSWLLTRGRPPDPKNRNDLIEFLGWMGKGKTAGVFRGKRRQWSFQCGRSTVLNVFGAISTLAAGAADQSKKLDAALKDEDPWLDYIEDWEDAPTESGSRRDGDSEEDEDDSEGSTAGDTVDVEGENDDNGPQPDLVGTSAS